MNTEQIKNAVEKYHNYIVEMSRELHRYPEVFWNITAFQINSSAGMVKNWSAISSFTWYRFDWNHGRWKTRKTSCGAGRY